MPGSTVPTIEPTILSHLKQNGLLREGHFVFKSGHHSGALIDRDLLLADPQAASQMGYAISRLYFGNKVETVASPSVWGAGLAQWVGYFLEPRAKVVYATPGPDGSRFIAERLHPMIAGKRVLLVDNLVLSGETMRWLREEIERIGGDIVGATSLWDSTANGDATERPFGLLNESYPAYTADACPWCARRDGEPTHAPY